MVMMIAGALLLLGVIYGYYTIKGSGISERPYGKGDAPGLKGSTFDDPIYREDPFENWSRGTR